MSSRKSKLDLIARVRYTNPLPPPPFPPKLLHIPTDPARYARHEFTSALANEALLPMVVDAECGMPLDLAQWECLWEEGADDSALNPDPDKLPQLDPKDLFLMADVPPNTGAFSSREASFNANAPTTPGPSAPHVTWLRRTEYLSANRDDGRKNTHLDAKPAQEEVIDVSRSAQIRDIEQSFPASSELLNLSSIKHPTRHNLTAVDYYEVLPDPDTWANAYDLFKFSERPGERPLEVPDPRLDCAILRPMEQDGDHFLAYYLTKEDDVATAFKELRLKPLDPDTEDDPANATTFHWVRDYETVKVDQDVANEFILVLDDGDEADSDSMFNDDQTSRVRGKGAFYKNIERKIALKKKRTNKNETPYEDKWDAINLSHAPLTAEDIEEREETLAEVVDPKFMLRMEVDEVEVPPLNGQDIAVDA